MNNTERIAVLETKMGTTELMLKQVADQQQQMLLELTRYRGAWGSIAIIGSAVVAAVQILKAWAAEVLK